MRELAGNMLGVHDVLVVQEGATEVTLHILTALRHRTYLLALAHSDSTSHFVSAVASTLMPSRIQIGRAHV